MPLVSVIVPVYRVEAYLDTCVESLVNQTLEDIEIILVDDGSPDNCPAMCDAWAKKDSRIKVLHKENGGLASARNAALEISSGEYIGFADSDDYADVQMFEKLYESAKQYDADISICAHYTFNESSMIEHKLPFDKKCYTKDEIAAHFVFPLIGSNPDADIPNIEGFVWRQLFKKETMKSILFQSERIYFAEDVVFDFEVYPICQTISVVNEPLYYYRYNEESLSNRFRSNLWEKLSALLEVKVAVLNKYSALQSEAIRLYNECLKFIQFTILNLNKAGCNLSTKQKAAVLRQIREDEQCRVVFENSVGMPQDKKTKLLVLLLKCKAYYAIVFALRWI